MVNGQGYLYANGTDNTVTLPLSYTEDAGDLKGFNLLGNPFTCNLTSSDAIKIGEVGNETFTDRAYLQIGGGNTLRKMTLKDHTTRLSLQHEGSDWVAATIETAKGEIPVNFKAAENGTYTLIISGTLTFHLSTTSTSSTT